MMTTKEAAAALRLSEQTIWRYIRTGELSGRKVGRQYLIPASEVEAKREPERHDPPSGGKAQA